MENKIKFYKEVEEYFIEEKDTCKQGYKINEGNGKIMLSAPHSVNQVRNNKLKIGEARTGLIIKEINNITGSPIIFKSRNLNDDANYDSHCEFKYKLMEYLTENSHIKALIDLHISSDKRNYDIDIGTGYSNNICGRNDLLILMVNKFKGIYQDTCVNHTFSASYENTVSATISRKLNIPSFQIEINWKNIDNYNKMEKFILKLTEIVKEMEELL